MLQTRFNLITADPLRLADAVKFVEGEVRPAVERLRGSLGMSLFTNPELGVAIAESFWASREALVQSEERISPDCSDAVRRTTTGTVSVESYQVPVFEWEWDEPLGAGAGVRLTRMDIEPSRVEDAVETYGDTVVPWLAETEGFLGALLLVDPGAGRSISQTIWRNHQTLAASRTAAAAVRVDMAASTGCVLRAVDEYGLVFSTARKA